MKKVAIIILVSCLGLGPTVLFADNIEEAEKYAKQGEAKAEIKDYVGAMQDYTEAIELNPEDANAYFKRGVLKDQVKNTTGAVQDYDRQLRQTLCLTLYK